MIDYNLLKLKKNGQLSEKSLDKFLMYCNGEERWDAFWELTHDYAEEYPMSWKTFYKGLVYAYGSGKASHSEAKEMFDEIWNFDEYATKEEIKWLESKFNGNRITLYRGCVTKEIDEDEIGVSWTTDLGIAEFFAYRFEDKVKEAGYQPCVIKTEVTWAYVKAVLLDRDEDEVVVTELYSDDVEIISTEPTEAFDNYMKNKSAN